MSMSLVSTERPTTYDQPRESGHVGFDALIEKVRQAEDALEAKERQTGADWRQVKASWRAMWTPGRIVVAGLVSGFVVGRAEPFKRAAGGGTLQLISALSTLFAGDKAKQAADQADEAADAAKGAEHRADAVLGTPGTHPEGVDSRLAPEEARLRGDARPYEVPETFRDSGHL